MAYVKVDDIELFYEEKGSGLPLIFLHPPGMGHVVFHEQRKLAKHFRIIVFDMRGHGRSELGSKEFSIALLANDLNLLVEALSIKEAVLIGYSSGGSVAQEFAIQHQEKVAGLLLCGGFSEVSDPFLQAEFRAGKALVHKMKVLSWILAKGHARSEAEFKMLRSYIVSTNPYLLENFYEKGRRYVCTNKLSALYIPFMHVTGERAFYFHRYQQIYKKYVPESKLIRVSNSYHELPTKSWRELNQIIYQFATSIELNRR
ncbi:alpha/beta fold hydrolase [Bacillus hwajinpoensis]|uniref:Alpha/beta fold hydrolase n=1 Tax=Guptibacillus hwajinpoensis TaxID=208199 RepID=A0A845ERG7_9BACL|nr:alpha/beta hydrolase [Pseudalkalibacillus hwajinpoensis]MYL62402.1 alpha/beta fold hydrolase [Pseudalkalibacillus hwajinpoensis]